MSRRATRRGVRPVRVAGAVAVGVSVLAGGAAAAVPATPGATTPVPTRSAAPSTPSSPGTPSSPATSTSPAGAADADDDAEAPPPAPVGRPYPGDPAREAELVRAEQARVAKLRTITILAGREGGIPARPYRITTDRSTTLVLPARPAPYTLPELSAADPGVVGHAGNTFEIARSILVRPGAALDLSAPGAVVRLRSEAGGFAAILNDGGRLRVAGVRGRPIRITSWDPARRAADATTADGRAYVRSIGGSVDVADAEFSDLGFWSGPTGGLALVGRDRPSTKAITDLSAALAMPRKQVAAAAAKPTRAPRSSPELRVPDVDLHDPRYLAATGAVRDSTFSRNAYGVFVAAARGVELSGLRVDHSLTHGIVLHRDVAGSAVRSCASTDNNGHGVVVDRGAANDVVVSTEASRNGGDGVHVDGEPLATGPNAAGAAVTAPADNQVRSGRMVDNGGAGVNIVGGRTPQVVGNTVLGGRTGIVVAKAAAGARVTDNVVERPGGHGIAVRPGVTGAVIERNRVDGGASGVYVRDAQVAARGNALHGQSDHGITLVGAVAGSQVEHNVIGGEGPSAIDTMRAQGIDLGAAANDTAGWSDTTPWQVRLRRAASPLTLVWLGLGALVVVTALRGRRRPLAAHPYDDKRPLADLTRLVDRSSLRTDERTS